MGIRIGHYLSYHFTIFRISAGAKKAKNLAKLYTSTHMFSLCRPNPDFRSNRVTAPSRFQVHLLNGSAPE